MEKTDNFDVSIN